VRYEGSESITLSEPITQQTVYDRVHHWMETEVGSQYQIKKTYPDGFQLKRAWIDTCWKALLTMGFLFSLLDLVYIAALGSLQLMINQAAYFAIGLLFLLAAIFFIFESRVLIDIHGQGSVVTLELKSTNKAEAEIDFDSIIMAISNN